MFNVVLRPWVDALYKGLIEELWLSDNYSHLCPVTSPWVNVLLCLLLNHYIA